MSYILKLCYILKLNTLTTISKYFTTLIEFVMLFLIACKDQLVYCNHILTAYKSGYQAGQLTGLGGVTCLSI